MSNYYLDFEKPVKELDDQIVSLSSLAEPSKEDLVSISKLKEQRTGLIQTIYSGLSRWQRIQLARHPNRPFSLDYINYFSHDFIELHGDRHYMDDHAVIAGLGHMDKYKIAWIGQQKGRNTKDNLYRNFGMMRPEGYRKAMRLMRLAEKFDLPVVSLIDTPGAYPGLGAEERGQGEAIARNLMEMAKLNVPILAIVIGEGASGGALGIGLCDRLIMLENTWYSVISPEGCASILWHDAMKASDAADAMKVTPKDLEEIGICDRIINEPTGGAHREPEQMNQILKKIILEELDLIVDQNDNKDYLQSRIKRYEAMGRFQEN